MRLDVYSVTDVYKRQAKDLPNIFDRFYRTDASRNSSKGGSGIGLSIVKKIIEDHGGKIWATSREGVGTVMYLSVSYTHLCMTEAQDKLKTMMEVAEKNKKE